MAREAQPDIILLDTMTPKLDGLTVPDMLQDDPSMRRIPVVILSAKALQEDVQTGLGRGARAYLTQPFDALHLEGRLDGVVGGRSANRRPVPELCR